MDEPFVDIHCHLIPGIDDGAKSWQESLAMARMAVHDGIRTVIVTPHQLGAYAHNGGERIRQATVELQRYLVSQNVDLKILPGADVRIEPERLGGFAQGEILTLADQHRHVLLELPHETYFELDGFLQQLRQLGLVGILSHPERNQGLLRQPEIVARLLRHGCLMQVTAGSLLGNFGRRTQVMSERMLAKDQVQFVATDAHGARARRPLMQRAFMRVRNIAGPEKAKEIFCHNPARVVTGQSITICQTPIKTNTVTRWLPWKKAA